MDGEAPGRPLDPRLSHLAGSAERAESRMVDVGDKPASERSATARVRIVFPRGVLAKLLSGEGPKGAVTEVARTAGILGAKRTADLIPMCHPLGLDHVEIAFERAGDDELEIVCRTRCHASTGVEMESLVGAAIAALTVYDMGKGLDKGIRIEVLALAEKRGGKSGAWSAPARPGPTRPAP
jgi:cyclic pyranopterin phosphate synthase